MSKKEKTVSPDELIKEAAEELLSFLRIEADMKVDEDEEGIYHLRLESPEAGLLIGYHGETLESFQLILGLIVYRNLHKWQPIVVHVGDYREKKEAALKEMAKLRADEVRQKREAVVLSGLTAAERRIIHLALSGREDVYTQSEGEGKERCLIINPKEKTNEKFKENA